MVAQKGTGGGVSENRFNAVGLWSLAEDGVENNIKKVGVRFIKIVSGDPRM